MYASGLTTKLIENRLRDRLSSESYSAPAATSCDMASTANTCNAFIQGSRRVEALASRNSEVGIKHPRCAVAERFESARHECTLVGQRAR